jgi:hypothetical protein
MGEYFYAEINTSSVLESNPLVSITKKLADQHVHIRSDKEKLKSLLRQTHSRFADQNASLKLI